jgi:hypothetical protein
MPHIMLPINRPPAVLVCDVPEGEGANHAQDVENCVLDSQINLSTL